MLRNVRTDIWVIPYSADPLATSLHSLQLPDLLTHPPPWGILCLSGWVRRGGAFRTPSGPKGSSGKEVSPGAAGVPARTFLIAL
jgi:hypothetical protein